MALETEIGSEIRRQSFARKIERKSNEIIYAEPNAAPGTFCPQCKLIYIGRETILGRPPAFLNNLTPITRCDYCGYMAAWVK